MAEQIEAKKREAKLCLKYPKNLILDAKIRFALFSSQRHLREIQIDNLLVSYRGEVKIYFRNRGFKWKTKTSRSTVPLEILFYPSKREIQKYITYEFIIFLN